MAKSSRGVEAVVRARPRGPQRHMRSEKSLAVVLPLILLPTVPAFGPLRLVRSRLQEGIGMRWGESDHSGPLKGARRYNGRGCATCGRCALDPDANRREVAGACPWRHQSPWAIVATMSVKRGATSIPHENGQLAVYIFVDIAGRDLGGYVADAQGGVAARSPLPQGLFFGMERSVRILERAKQRLASCRWTLALIFLLLFSQLPRIDRDVDCHAFIALRARRGDLADLVHGVQHCPSASCPWVIALAGRVAAERGHHADLSRFQSPFRGQRTAQGPPAYHKRS